MDDLTRIRSFIKVVEAGSFTAAAKDVVSTSSIARQIKSLEDEVGIRLVQRSTRSFAITDVGQLFYERAKVLVSDYENAKFEARSHKEEVKGLLRVQLRVAAGATLVVPALPRFLEKYQELDVEIIISDERIDLIKNNIDIAMWLGEIPDSELVAQRVSPSQRITCASPQYLERCGEPTTPADLKHHDCLIYLAPSYGSTWSFSNSEERWDVEVNGRLRSSNGLILLAAATSGLGIGICHRGTVNDLLVKGQLKRILSNYQVNPRPGDADIFAVYPSSRGLSLKVKVFVNFLKEIFDQETHS